MQYIITIFGASGDLARLKIFPALYALVLDGKLGDNFAIVGYARTKIDNQKFAQIVESSLDQKFGSNINQIAKSKLLSRLSYFSGEYTDPKSFEMYNIYLKDQLGIDLKRAVHIAYFAVPPSVFGDIANHIAATNDIKTQDIRLVIEKPFGLDQASARDLYTQLTEKFTEEKIFLLDHYLGKQNIRKIIDLRSANLMLANIVQPDFISSIEITALERIHTEARKGYFDQVGIVKDMIQSHLLQILAITLMSIPVESNIDNFRQEKLTILQGLKFIPDQTKFGQYKSYRQPGFEKSNTPTFAQILLILNRQAWFEVPIKLTTGKSLDQDLTEVKIRFKNFAFQTQDNLSHLTFQLKPNEEIKIQFFDPASPQDALVLRHELGCYSKYCSTEHGQLLSEVVDGDQRYFLSFDEVVASWELIDQVEKHIAANQDRLSIYDDGSYPH